MKLRVLALFGLIHGLTVAGFGAQAAAVPWKEVNLVVGTQSRPIFPLKIGTKLYYSAMVGKQLAYGASLYQYDPATQKEEVILDGKIFGLQRLGDKIYVDFESSRGRRFELFDPAKKITAHPFPAYPRQFARLQYQIDQEAKDLGFRSSALATRKWLIRDNKLQILFSVNGNAKRYVVGDLPFETSALPSYSVIEMDGNEPANADQDWIEGWVVREGKQRVANDGTLSYRQHYLVRGFGANRQFLIIDQKAAEADPSKLPRHKRWTTTLFVVPKDAKDTKTATFKFPDLKVGYPAFLVDGQLGALIADRTEAAGAAENVLFLNDKKDEAVSLPIPARDVIGVSEVDGGYVIARPLMHSITWIGEKLPDAEKWQNPVLATHSTPEHTLFSATCPESNYALHVLDPANPQVKVLTHRELTEAVELASFTNIHSMACEKGTVAFLVDGFDLRQTSGHGALALKQGEYASNMETDGHVPVDAKRGPVILYFEGKGLKILRQAPENMAFTLLARHPTEPLFAAWMRTGDKPFDAYLSVFPTSEGFEGYEYVAPPGDPTAAANGAK